MNRREFLKSCAAGALALSAGNVLHAADNLPAAVPATKPAGRPPYLLGADISWLLQDEAQGAIYWDRGVKKDIFDILKTYHINAIRARVFVNPAAPGGYNRQGFCDLEHTKQLANRVKAAGMSLLVDFHYGDTWTSPGAQAKPAAWANYTFDQLVSAVHDWTHTVLVALKDNKTPPEMVQIGNETSDGMLFPDGRSSNFDNFAALTNAGCKATREVDPKIKIAIHNHLGRDNNAIRAWVDNFLKRKTDFDIIGMSCYNEAKPGDWKNNFDDIAVRYPQLSFMALEYSYKKRYLNDFIFNAPNQKGLGSFIWEPTRWREAIFDHGGVNAGNDSPAKPHLPATTLPPESGVAQLPPETQPAVQPATAPAQGGRGARGGGNGGRYDTNSYILEYPAMAKAYGLIS